MMFVKPQDETLEMLIYAGQWWYYDPLSGKLYWNEVTPEIVGRSNTMTATQRAERRNRIYANQRAGHLSKRGWLYTIRQRVFLGSRLAWGLSTAAWPPADDFITYRDKDRSNQRPDNLQQS